MKMITVLIACTILLSSCIPAKYAITPGVNGKIIDKETLAPIPKAKVSLEKNPQISTDTNDEGYFRLTAIKEWQPFIIMGVGVDHAPPSDRLIVDATGYQTNRTERIYGSYGDNLIWLNIQLERMKKEVPLTNGSTGPPKNQAPGEP